MYERIVPVSSMSIVTKTGDGGTTSLYGGKRVSKASVRLHAYGTVDELNAVLGMVNAEVEEGPLREKLLRTQQLLFRLGADLASPNQSLTSVPRIEQRHVEELEQWMRNAEPTLPPQKCFLLPTGSRLETLLHFARTVCRRAERWVIALAEQEEVGKPATVYLNRLSDFLFITIRCLHHSEGVQETEVDYST